MGAVLAIDHGSKRTGFAASDPLRIATRPLEVWKGPGGGDELVEHVILLVDERDVTHVVVGMPFNMDGTPGPRAAEVRAFLAKLRARRPDLVLVEQDERLTSKEAEELLREAGHGPEERRAMRDSWSALVILRDWIEADVGS